MTKVKKEKAQTQLDKYVAIQKEITDFKATIARKTREELDSAEQELIKESDKVNAEVQAAKFSRTEENYKETCRAVKKLINKATVPWQQVQMMLDINDAWDETTPPVDITYKDLDATLRNLGQLQFSGVDEWTACETVNAYMEQSGLKDKYLEATEKLYLYAEKHNAVMQAQEALEGAAKLASPEAANKK